MGPRDINNGNNDFTRKQHPGHGTKKHLGLFIPEEWGLQPEGAT